MTDSLNYDHYDDAIARMKQIAQDKETELSGTRTICGRCFRSGQVGTELTIGIVEKIDNEGVVVPYWYEYCVDSIGCDTHRFMVLKLGQTKIAGS